MNKKCIQFAAYRQLYYKSKTCQLFSRSPCWQHHPFSSTTYSTDLPHHRTPCLWFPRFNRLESSGNGVSLPKLIHMPDGEKPPDSYHLLSCTEDKKIICVKEKKLKQHQKELLSLKDRLCVGSSHGWLLYENPRKKTICLFNPLLLDASTFLPYIPLPPSPLCTRAFDKVAFSSPPIPIPSSASPFKNIARKLFCLFSSIIYSMCNNLPNENNQQEKNKRIYCNQNEQNCTILIMSRSHLVFCKPGEISWTSLPRPEEKIPSFLEVLYFTEQRRFYALTGFYDQPDFHPSNPDTPKFACLVSIDLNDPFSPKIDLIKFKFPPPQKPIKTRCGFSFQLEKISCRHFGFSRHYLVESSGELLMVVRYTFYVNEELFEPIESNPWEYCVPPDYIWFEVYTFDFLQKQWISVPSLGDRALFVGLNQSVSLSTIDHPELRANSIYFTSHENDFSEDSDGRFDAGVYSMVDDTVAPFYVRDIIDKQRQDAVWMGCEELEKLEIFYDIPDIAKALQPPIWIIPQGQID